jgi:hypothetical protein
VDGLLSIRAGIRPGNVRTFLSTAGDGIGIIWVEAKESVFLLLVRRCITAMVLIRKASRISKDLFD